MLKNILLVLFFVFVGVFLGGCEKKEINTEAQNGTNQPKIELYFYNLFDDSEIFAPFIQQYENSRPGVKIHYKKFVDVKKYEKMLIDEIANGEGPDIFALNNSLFLYHRKKISPAPESIFSPNLFREIFVPVAANDLILYDNEIEKVFGLPLSVDTLALYYNESHFKDVFPSRPYPAADWETFLGDILSLKKSDHSIYRFTRAAVALGRTDNILRGLDFIFFLLLQNKTIFYAQDFSSAVFATPQGVDSDGKIRTPGREALELFTAFAQSNNQLYTWNEILADPQFDYEIYPFLTGRVSMIAGYSYLYDQLKNKLATLKKDPDSLRVKSDIENLVDVNDIKITSWPQKGSGTGNSIYLANYFPLTVSRTSKNPLYAWDFLKFLTTQENLRYYHEKTKRPTSRRDLIEEQSMEDLMGIFARQLNGAASLPIFNSQRFEEIFSEAVNLVITGRKSTRDVLKEAEDKVTELLKEENKNVQ